MHLLGKYDVAPVGRNDAMFATKHQAKPTSLASASSFVKQHHLPKANIIQKSLICPVDKLGFFVGGDEGGRTPYLLNAIQALYQLSYTPGAKFSAIDVMVF